MEEQPRCSFVGSKYHTSKGFFFKFCDVRNFGVKKKEIKD
jgi:hypothetical protein